jgi:hypothetical protein
MVEAFGKFAWAVEAVLVLWAFIVGFWIKGILKAQQETNRLLRESAQPAVAKESAEAPPKAA